MTQNGSTTSDYFLNDLSLKKNHTLNLSYLMVLFFYKIAKNYR